MGKGNDAERQHRRGCRDRGSLCSGLWARGVVSYHFETERNGGGGEEEGEKGGEWVSEGGNVRRWNIPRS